MFDNMALVPTTKIRKTTAGSRKLQYEELHILLSPFNIFECSNQQVGHAQFIQKYMRKLTNGQNKRWYHLLQGSQDADI